MHRSIPRGDAGRLGLRPDGSACHRTHARLPKRLGLQAQPWTGPALDPLSAVNIFIKDLGIVLDSARKLPFPLPLTSSAHQM